MDDCKIGCLIMASGISKRFNGNKLIANLCGRPVVDYAITIANMPIFTERLLVTRLEETADFCRNRIKTIKHDYPTKSMAMELGIKFLLELDRDLDGIIFLQADQPLLCKSTIEKLCLKFAENKTKICRLSFEGEEGAPVIFPKSVFNELMNISDGKGGASVIKKHPEFVVCVEALDKYEMFDIDRVENLKEAEEFLKSKIR